jgi:hypothetical protein
VVDGETCLYDGLAVLFPQATFAVPVHGGRKNTVQSNA